LRADKYEYDESESWHLKVDKYEGGELIRGEIEGVNFEYSRLEIQRDTGDSDEGTNGWVFIHKGLFFHADLQKDFLGKTFILPNKWWDGILEEEDFKVPLVQIGQPDFERDFDVHSTKPNEARYLLTTKMMETILSLKEKYNTGVRFSFVGSSVYGAIDFEENLFNPRILRSGVEFDDVVAMHDLIKITEDIIQELYVNTKDLVPLDSQVLDEKIQINVSRESPN